MKIKDMVKATKMEKHNFPKSAATQLEEIMQMNNCPKCSKQEYVDKERAFVAAMDNLLTEEQRLLLHEYGGSCRGGETGKQCKKLKHELGGLTIAEKIDRMNKNGHIYPTRLNSDGTITARCGCDCLKERYKNPDAAKAPSAYGCAAGAALANLKTALGVKARIKSIDYPQAGDGKRYMEFVFEILE